MRKKGSIPDVGVFGFQAWTRRASLGHGAHIHHDFEVNHVASGWCEYVLGGRRVRLTAGRSYLFWATLPHQMVAVAPETDMGWVVLPVGWLWQWQLPRFLAAALLGGDVLADSQPESDDVRAIKRWGDMLSRHDPQWTRIAELEVEARMRRMLLVEPEILSSQSVRPSSRNDRSSHVLHRIHAMAAFMTEHSREPLTVAEVAEHVSLDASYAMRLFRKYMNMTCIDYLTQQRIAEVKRRLLTSDEPILNIAFDCGFGSTSRFYEAFQRITGTTPAQFRNAIIQSTDPHTSQ